MGGGASRDSGVGVGALGSLAERLPRLGSLHCVMLGLDAAGKTTLLYRLKFGQYVNAAPTIGFNCEKIRSQGASFTVWDVGGQDKMRPLWRSYTRATDAVIFVVDASREARLEEAALELQRFCQSSSNNNGGSAPQPPVLVLANKQDLPGALDAGEVERRLAVKKSANDNVRVLPVCAVTGDGLDEGMAALLDMIAQAKRKTTSSSSAKKFKKAKRTNGVTQ